MHCQSYFPSYSSHYDLNINTNGGVRTIYNGNGIFCSGHYNNYMPSLSHEFIRQTIIMHEVTFRHQVKELHRLYRRQKELMGEIKINHLYMSHLHLDLQGSNSFLENFGQNAINSGIDGNLEYNHVLDSVGKKIGRKFLDLKLPADAYIDPFKGEPFEDVQFPKVKSSGGLCLNVPTMVVLEIDPMPSSANNLLDLNPKGESLCSSSFRRAKTNLADLNEPLIASDLEHQIPEGIDSCPEVSGRNHDLFEKGCTRLEGSSNESHTEVHQDSPLTKIACKLETDLNESISVSSTSHVNGLNHLDLNSTVVENPDFSSNDTSTGKAFEETDIEENDELSPKITKKSWLIDINLPCDPTLEEDKAIVENDFGHGHDQKDPCQMNLNLSIDDDDKSPQKFPFSENGSLEIDSEAPLSPKFEEQPPPCGDFEENKPDAALDELVKITADAIVSLSTSAPQKCPEKYEPSGTETLEWFAGLVHSLSSESDTPIIDEFEAMTLSLTEMKVEEYWCKNNFQIESFPDSMSLSGGQTRKGRMRRSKHQNFQRELLPSLASLSRYEVTEDIQMIEGLMEAASTPWQLCRARRGCRMVKKPRAIKPECSPYDKRLFESRSGSLIGWGKANRRCRGQRSPASPSSVLSKWLEYMN